jgi:hypothetical protein
MGTGTGLTRSSSGVSNTAITYNENKNKTSIPAVTHITMIKHLSLFLETDYR